MAELALIVAPDQDEPSFACIYVDGTVAGRAYRFVLDTGAPRTQLTTDECTGSLPTVGAYSSAGAFGGRASEPLVTVADLVAGPLRAATLDVTRASNGPNLLGMDVLGPDRVIYAMDYPYQQSADEVAAYDGFDISAEHKRMLMQTNAERVFRIGN